MARTDAKRNVVVIVSRDPAGAAATAYKARSVEVQTDGTLALGTAQTGATYDDVLLKIRQPSGEGSALYNPEEIFQVVQVPEHQLT